MRAWHETLEWLFLKLVKKVKKMRKYFFHLRNQFGTQVSKDLNRYYDAETFESAAAIALSLPSILEREYPDQSPFGIFVEHIQEIDTGAVLTYEEIHSSNT